MNPRAVPDVESTEEAVLPRWVRPSLYGFLAVFVACGLLSIEVWPLTGWRLYHERRTTERSSWQLVAVDAGGEEATIHLGELPLGWRNTTRLLGEFDDLGADGRDEVCAAWAAPLRDDGVAVEEVRIYRVRSDLDDPDARARELRWTCGR